MVIEITRREVLNNLIRLKDSLSAFSQKGKQEWTPSALREKHRVYKALLNKKTGDMRFAKKISSLENHFPVRGDSKGSIADWREIHLIVDEKEGAPTLQFEVLDEKDDSLNPKEINELAWRIVSETLNVLNKKGEVIDGRDGNELPEALILEDLSSIHLVGAGASLENIPGWVGSIDRQEAEEKLNGKPIGTYLLREGDSLTLSISFHLAEENMTHLHPYLLTYVNENEKISEVFIMHTAKGWTLFSDDPDLNQPFYQYFSMPEELIKTISHLAKTPFQ